MLHSRASDPRYAFVVGTHFIAYCGDNGIAPVQAAGLLSFAVFYGLDWIATGHQLGAPPPRSARG